jgi:hypothetical protein
MFRTVNLKNLTPKPQLRLNLAARHRAINPQPSTLNPTPRNLNPEPCTLNLKPYSQPLRQAEPRDRAECDQPSILRPTKTLSPALYTLNPKPWMFRTANLKILNPKPLRQAESRGRAEGAQGGGSVDSRAALALGAVLHPKPETRYPKRDTQYPKPETRNPQP